MKKDADDLLRRVNQVLVDFGEDTEDGWQASYERWLAKTMGSDPGSSEPPAPEYLRVS
ncbi:glutamate ABC transporter substrate-binding protein [Streptomyces hirsutus]